MSVLQIGELEAKIKCLTDAYEEKLAIEYEKLARALNDKDAAIKSCAAMRLQLDEALLRQTHWQNYERYTFN